MDNKAIARHLRDMAQLLEADDHHPNQVLKYRKAAERIRDLHTELQEDEARLSALRMDKSIRSSVHILLTEGAAAAFANLPLSSVPASLREVMQLPGIGPKTARRYWLEAGVADCQTLQSTLHGPLRAKLGTPIQTARLEASVTAWQERQRRIPLAWGRTAISALQAELAQCTGVCEVQVTGEIARFCTEARCLTLLAAFAALEDRKQATGALRALGYTPVNSDSDEAATREGLSLPERQREQQTLLVQLATLTGRQAATCQWFYRQIELTERVADVWVLLLPRGAMASAVVATSGDDLYTEALHCLCEQQQSSHHDRPSDPKATTELGVAAVFSALDLPFIEPELREGFSMTLGGRRLLRTQDIRGDLHMHTDASDGQQTLTEMVERCIAKGYQYLAITDHSQSLHIAHGLSVERLQRQQEEISRLRDKYPNICILHGTEVDILNGNTLDFADDVLAMLDIVVASVHTGFQQSAAELTARILYAIEHPHVDILAHPTGRMLGRRDPYPVDLERVFQSAGRRVALEHNSNPSRLDLDPQWLRIGLEMGCLFVVDSDAHSIKDLDRVADYGVVMARKGWLSPDHVLNTRPLPDLLTWLRTPKDER
ncbi:MAG: PHP domain-containing protein [Firmicutes bacterium]|nr:PHP domain-containing protein [Bacillota bacterium]